MPRRYRPESRGILLSVCALCRSCLFSGPSPENFITFFPGRRHVLKSKSPVTDYPGPFCWQFRDRLYPFPVQSKPLVHILHGNQKGVKAVTVSPEALLSSAVIIRLSVQKNTLSGFFAGTPAGITPAEIKGQVPVKIVTDKSGSRHGIPRTQTVPKKRRLHHSIPLQIVFSRSANFAGFRNILLLSAP